MADEQRVSQGGVTVPSELADQTERVSQGGVTIPAELAQQTEIVSQGGVTVPGYLVVQTLQVSQGGVTVIACIKAHPATGLAVARSGLDLVLTWTDSIDPVDYYRITFSTDGVTYTDIDTVLPGIGTYTDPDVLNGAACNDAFYYVIWTVSGLCGDDSVGVSFTVTTPATPTGLTYSTVAAGDDKVDVTLTWTDAATNESRYVVERSNDGFTYATLANLGAGATGYTDAGVPVGVVRYYRVSACLADCCSLGAVTRATIPRPCTIIWSPKLLGVYKVLTFDLDGNRTAEFDTWRSLELKHILDDADYATLTLTGAEALPNYFVPGAPIEIWRRIPGRMPTAVPADRLREGNWYCEWEGLQGDFEETYYPNGDWIFVARMDDNNDFLRRREILYKASIAAGGSKKISLPAQTAMYEFVRENLGSAATLANGRLAEGTVTGFEVPAMIGNGPLWSGGRAYRTLLDVIKELALYSNIDFDVISKGNARWSFETYPNQLGQDRTKAGLVPATGLNGAGNAPVVFSRELENIAQITFKSTRRASANVVAALGKGEYDLRDVQFAYDTAEIDAKRINQRELTRNANTQDSSAELQAYAEGELAQVKAEEDFKFVPLVTQTTVYGVHFWWTDRVTAIHRGIERDKRLTGLTIRVDENGEQFSDWNFQTIPRAL